ncbi:MAG: hypothetical protein ACI4HO_09085 [Ruminococcus sp.]
MAVEVFKLFGSIFVNNDEANKSISATDKKAKGVASTLGSGIKTAAKWGTAIVGGATVAAGGLFKMASSAANTTDHIDKMSQRIGISRQSYQELDFICSQTGTSVDSLKNGLKTMRSVMDITAQGNSKTATALERLGISAVDTQGNLRKSEEVMWESLKALQGMENETEKARLASMLFGRAGSDLMPLLNGSSKSIEDMKKQAHELGLVLSDEAVDSGVKFTDTLDQTKRSLSAIGTKLGASLMPIITNVMNRIQGGLPYIQNLFGQLEPVITSLFDNLLPPLGELGKSLFPVLLSALTTILPLFGKIANTIMPIFVDLIQMLLPPIIQIIETLLPPLMEIIQALLPLIQTIFDLLTPIIELIFQIIEPIANLISEALAPLIDNLAQLINDLLQPFIPVITELAGVITDVLAPVFENLSPIIKTISKALSPIFRMLTSLLEYILPAIMPIIEALANVFSSVLGTALSGVKDSIDGIFEVFSGLIDFITGVFTGDWEKAWNGIKSIFKGVWDALFGIIKTPINLIIDGINLLWSGIYSAVKGIVDSIGGIAGAIGDLFGQDWHFSMPEKPPTIPKLEEGGVLEKGQVGFLEGNGDEAVVPLSQNTEWIDRVADKVYANIQKDSLPINNKNIEPMEKSPVFNISFNIQGVDIKNDNDIRSFADKLSEMFASSILEKKGAFA